MLFGDKDGKERKVSWSCGAGGSHSFHLKSPFVRHLLPLPTTPSIGWKAKQASLHPTLPLTNKSSLSFLWELLLLFLRA